MKKQMTAIAVLCAVICLSGCGANVGTADTPAAETTVSGTETKAADNTAQVDLNPLVGEWNYETISTADNTTFSAAGSVTVREDGSFTFRPNDGSDAKNGTVRIEYEEYADGSKQPLYAFYEGGTTFWIGCYCDHQEENIFYAGNGGMERLIRSTENASAAPAADADNSAATTAATTTEAAASADGGTSDASNSAAETAYMSQIVGRWYHQELDQSAGAASETFNDVGYLTVNADGTFSYQPNDNSGAKNGRITIKYDTYADGTSLPFYSFTENNGTPWESCYCEEGGSDTYWIGNGGMSRFVRDTGNAAAGNHAEAAADISQLVGTWSYEEAASSDSSSYTQVATVTVKADGTYTYQPKDGSAAKIGTLRTGSEDWGDGTVEATFSFYENGTIYWTGGYMSHIRNGQCSLGNGDSTRLVRIS